MQRHDRYHDTVGSAKPKWFHLTVEQVLAKLKSASAGLSRQEVDRRLEQYGPNQLPEKRATPLLQVILRQFVSPFIYVLLIAAVVSLLIGEFTDAIFIASVLLLNAAIGSIQEYKAERSAAALKSLLTVKAFVEREGEIFEIDARQLVPGDLIYLQSGNRVPADCRLLSVKDLGVDESLLTGESVAVSKRMDVFEEMELPLAERFNMVFAGTIVTRGRGKAVVVATGSAMEIGQIARDIAGEVSLPPPLIQRMTRFTRLIAGFMGVAAVLLSLIGIFQGTTWNEIFFLVVALLVSAIPEGLPVAMTIALSIASFRMSRRHVIVRRLIAVEGLGSCTLIGTDKTGTLTCNEMTVQRIAIPGTDFFQVSGQGYIPEGIVTDTANREVTAEQDGALGQLGVAISLANEAQLFHRDGSWQYNGDPTDVALLTLSHKLGLTTPNLESRYQIIDTIPFESERRYEAALVHHDGENLAFIKGAVESLLPRCKQMMTLQGEQPFDKAEIEQQVLELAQAGYRVIAVAQQTYDASLGNHLNPDHLNEMVFLGLVGMRDPLRPGVIEAVQHCHEAGIQVVMITGDHPLTALAIGRELGLAEKEGDVVTGQELARIKDLGQLAQAIQGKTVFARVEPHQKLAIVEALQKEGHFVAVTGDGANDAPALKKAHIGVAMGQAGTDVAREASDLVITDDNFASIINGVEEGRVAYSNIRKVINLLISTGVAEIVLVTLSVLFNTPLPLLPAQLLWLNLVTNGIQDVALAFEPNEGQILKQAPRAPRENIFNRLMINQTVVAALVMGLVSFTVFRWLLLNGYEVNEARNLILLLMVLFENVHVGNCRSETRSIFALSPLRNPILLWGTLAAQGIHILALHVPVMQKVLSVQPVSMQNWLSGLALALSLVIVMELHKLWWALRVRSSNASVKHG